jgi:hypothetical protein
VYLNELNILEDTYTVVVGSSDAVTMTSDLQHLTGEICREKHTAKGASHISVGTRFCSIGKDQCFRNKGGIGPHGSYAYAHRYLPKNTKFCTN